MGTFWKERGKRTWTYDLVASSIFKITKLKYFMVIGQGFNARKVISEVSASFVLQCTVTGR